MGKPRTWTDKQLTNAVKKSFSYSSTLEKIGLRPTGGNYEQVKKYIKELELDTSHFTGQRWNRGKTFGSKVNLNDKLKKDTNHNSNRLRKQLISQGIFEKKCYGCNLDKWLDNPIPLELDHINGIKTDNRIENLRILCPNCHALTPTYRGKNIINS